MRIQHIHHDTQYIHRDIRYTILTIRDVNHLSCNTHRYHANGTLAPNWEDISRANFSAAFPGRPPLAKIGRYVFPNHHIPTTDCPYDTDTFLLLSQLPARTLGAG